MSFTRNDGDLGIGLLKACDVRVELGSIPLMRLIACMSTLLRTVVDVGVDRHIASERDT